MTNLTVEQRTERPWVGVSMTAELAHWDRVNAHVPRVYGAWPRPLLVARREGGPDVLGQVHRQM